MATRLIVGCGYVGLRAAKKWIEAGDCVLAITRADNRVEELTSAGLHPIVWNWLSTAPDRLWPPKVLGEKNALTTVLVCVSHAVSGHDGRDNQHAVGLTHLLQGLQCLGSERIAQTQWIYLSTTGVFAAPHEAAGWVDELAKVDPKRPGTINAWQGEEWMRQHLDKGQFVVLRPAGIYGPERVPNCESLRLSKPIDATPESFLNLVHVEDLASTICIASNTTLRDSLYCISDGMPVRRAEYYRYISELTGLPPPVFESVREEKEGLSRRDSNKRVSSQRWSQETGQVWQYPSYRQGLQSLFGPHAGR